MRDIPDTISAHWPQLPTPTQTSTRKGSTDRDDGFRHVLRSATRGAHDATEHVFEVMERDPAGHLNWFMLSHLAAFRALSHACPGEMPAEADRALFRIIRDLTRDCADRQLPSDLPVDHPAALDPVAVAYVVLGSRMGTGVLRQRLKAAGVAPLPRYFAGPPGGDWRALCAHLGTIEPSSDRARGIVEDAKAAFALFAHSARIARAALD